MLSAHCQKNLLQDIDFIRVFEINVHFSEKRLVFTAASLTHKGMDSSQGCLRYLRQRHSSSTALSKE